MTTKPDSVPAAPTAAPTPPLVSPAAYNVLVASARLREIRLVKSEFTLNPEGLEHQPSWAQSHSCEIVESSYDADEGVLIAWVAAEATCMKQRKKIVSAKCKYLIVYHVDGQPDDTVVGAFAKRVARFAAYPYFRSHFAELASQAGLFLPPLPIIKERKLLPKTPEQPKIAAPEDTPKKIAN